MNTMMEAPILNDPTPQQKKNFLKKCMLKYNLHDTIENASKNENIMMNLSCDLLQLVGVYTMMTIFFKNPSRLEWMHVCGNFRIYNFLLALHMHYENVPGGLDDKQRERLYCEWKTFCREMYYDKERDFECFLKIFKWWELKICLKTMYELLCRRINNV
ncbi:hypothetical protein [Trichoplusia ni ascovirus 2c]|uniref:hypothetical protein n=1 Tax=Trichoplusia ni ascovirus 2c TaxID=328615 RepID=UPI0000E4425A|nr:hypothetical protein TNAV2c_gp130 [Trichoplusia ni ascovirus 2c]ABF70647.1 hypothetical protein [Trichoplusia ni ascovirus 2c]AUS94236.1 hypothetical protein [Trichoplusia ni ascovirus 6b]